MRLLKKDMVTGYNDLVKVETGLRIVPINKLPDRMIIRAAGTLGSQTVKYGRLRLLQVRQPKDSFRRALAFVFGHAAILTAICGAPSPRIETFGARASSEDLNFGGADG